MCKSGLVYGPDLAVITGQVFVVNCCMTGLESGFMFVASGSTVGEWTIFFLHWCNEVVFACQWKGYVILLHFKYAVLIVRPTRISSTNV